MSGGRWLTVAGAAVVALAMATCPARRQVPAPAAPEREATAPLPVPPSPPAAERAEGGGVPPAEARPSADDARRLATEGELAERLRQAVDADPPLALELAREGEERFPDGALADERAYLKARALVNLGRIARARDEAEAFFQRHPGSPYAERIYRLTGVHPRPPPPARRSP